jgi:hypothetical protein
MEKIFFFQNPVTLSRVPEIDWRARRRCSLFLRVYS